MDNKKNKHDGYQPTDKFDTSNYPKRIMEIIFVGMHNKPNRMPLCASTKSGKLINRICKGLPEDIKVLKTNLYDVDYFPLKEKYELALDWHERINLDYDDIIILLGAEVHQNFNNIYNNIIIKLAHPSSMWSHKNMNNYVLQAIEQIKNKLKWKL